MGNIAFNALRDLRFKSMIIRLDGDLAGEFAARLDIDGAGIGQSTQTQRIIRSLLAKIPLHLNVTITGLALIATAKSVGDPRTLIEMSSRVRSTTCRASRPKCAASRSNNSKPRPRHRTGEHGPATNTKRSEMMKPSFGRPD